VLFSGDGDFRRLLEAVQSKGLRTSVVSTVRSQPPMAADELRRQADHFIELLDIQDLIARSPQEIAALRRRDAPGHDHYNRAADDDDDDHDDDHDDESEDLDPVYHDA
jgi:hypothetical protein